ncbi:Periplasmic nitrate reductase, electron transfer subunit [Nymphon striatum]|nr:Periplasmic nitrate reductase, electron transfer subunit [Nymphon striatum]
MCEDIPCVVACPTGALDHSLTDINDSRMGLAVLIDQEGCIAYQGLRCEVCFNVCPVRGKAITIETQHNNRTVGGRVYCSWVCPINIVTDVAAWLRNKLGIKGGAQISRKARYWILGFTLVLALVTGSIAWELVNPVSMVYRGNQSTIERVQQKVSVPLFTSGECTNCGRCIDVCAEDVFRFETNNPFSNQPNKYHSNQRNSYQDSSSLILGLGLSVFATTAYSATDEEVKAAATEQATATQAATESPASDVKSATPPMTKVDFNGITSLRGEVALDGGNAAADVKLLAADSLPIERSFFQQPPLIPHRIREYKITVRNNKCMTCHSWSNYKKAKATKVSQTHFSDRDGNDQSSLAARRYFCTQCHVPQVDAKPLVENEFKPVSDLSN